MGLSVSASAGVIFIGALIVFGTVYPALSSRRSKLDESERHLQKFLRKRDDADIRINEVVYSTEDDVLFINVTNIGEVSHTLSTLDVFINQTYVDYIGNQTFVEGNEWGYHIFPQDDAVLGVEAEDQENIKLVDGFGNIYLHEEKVVEVDTYGI